QQDAVGPVRALAPVADRGGTNADRLGELMGWRRAADETVPVPTPLRPDRPVEHIRPPGIPARKQPTCRQFDRLVERLAVPDLRTHRLVEQASIPRRGAGDDFGID